MSNGREATAWVRLDPLLALHALRSDQGSLYASYAVAKAVDIEDGGHGLMTLEAFRAALGLRGLSRRSADHHLHQGDGLFWHWNPMHGLITLFSPGTVAARLDVDGWFTRPLMVPSAWLWKGGSTTAALVSVVHRPDDRNLPLTRQRIEELTGVSRGRQWELQRDYGYVSTVQRVDVRLDESDAPVPLAERDKRERSVAGARADDPGRWGSTYVGRAGHVMRRHGDIRRTSGAFPGSRSSMRRANRRLRVVDGSTDSLHSCDQLTRARDRRPRAYFTAPTADEAVAAFTRSKAARGKHALAVDLGRPGVDESYSACGVGVPGSMRWFAIFEPERVS